jgi:hypothetical protein
MLGRMCETMSPKERKNLQNGRGFFRIRDFILKVKSSSLIVP